MTGATRTLLAAGMEADLKGAIPLKPNVDTSGVHGGLVGHEGKKASGQAAGWHALCYLSANVLKKTFRRSNDSNDKNVWGGREVWLFVRSVWCRESGVNFKKLIEVGRSR